MVSLLVVQIIKYRLGVLVVAMLSRIRGQSRNPVKYVTPLPRKPKSNTNLTKNKMLGMESENMTI